MRLSQNFSFWESNLGFRGKSGLLAAFSIGPKVHAIPKTNRVLGMVLMAAVILVLLLSCGTFPGTARSRSWSLDEKSAPEGKIYINKVHFDAAAGWNALEEEASRALPLILLERNYLAVDNQKTAGYAMDVTLREREYLKGWKTKRSLSVEVCIWPGNGIENGIAVPLAAGSAIMQGGQSFSSSKTLYSLLKKAVKSAVKALERN
jgi:hypothetical protein